MERLAELGHGQAPLDAELGTAGVSLSLGLRKMTAHAAAVVPFAQAKELLAGLAGIELTTKRVERSAEADGQAAATAITTKSAAINTRVVVPLPLPGPLPDRLYIANYGTGVSMIGTKAAG